MIMHLFLRRDTTIVRVNLENFMQCESAEFRPEPDLSMLMDLGNEERTALYSGIVLGLGGDTKTATIRADGSLQWYSAWIRRWLFGKFGHSLCKTIPIQDIHGSKLYLQLYYDGRISRYVRRGSNEATIEIEVQATPGHTIFKRVIDRVHNTSTWSIDGMKS